MYSILGEPEKKAWYNMPAWFYFQVIFWVYYRHNKGFGMEDFKEGHQGDQREVFWTYYDLTADRSTNSEQPARHRDPAGLHTHEVQTVPDTRRVPAALVPVDDRGHDAAVDDRERRGADPGSRRDRGVPAVVSATWHGHE